MSQFRVRQIETPDELRESAAAWDALWQRSDVASPAARADVVALRVEHLAAGSTFRALIVERAGRMVAALPLVNRRLKGLLNVGSLPSNCWVAGGSLLVDPSVDAAAALDCLVSPIPELPWALLWFDHVSIHDPIWTAFRSAAARANLSVSVREHFEMGQIAIRDDWQSFLGNMKGDHRRKLTRLVRKLDEAGGADFESFRAMDPDRVDELVRRGFEVEDRSWKGAEGTSVLRNPAILEQYRQEARLLARLGHLELLFLKHRGQPIAFVYGWMAKGVHFMTKIGYDESFAKFAPGQQLAMRWLESLHAESGQRMIDTAGPLKDFHKVWNPRSYAVGPLVVATPRLLGRTLFHVYTKWQPRVRRIRERVQASVAAVRATAASAGAKLVRTMNFVERPTQPAASNGEGDA